MFVFCAIRKMQKIVFSLKLFLFFAVNISFTISQDSINRMKSSETFPEIPIRDGSLKCTNDLQSNDGGLHRKTTLVTLIDIESTDYIHPSNTIFSNKNNNLFFIESSGRNHINPRDACAIESAVKNSGISGRIVVAMTSPILDVSANNATWQIYTKFAESFVYFRFVNVDTIFQGTPFHELHINGHLIHHEQKNTVVQYR